jgi:hypothetical protein
MAIGYSVDDMEKWKFLPPPGLEHRPLGRPARSQSLYRLRYSGSLYNYKSRNENSNRIDAMLIRHFNGQFCRTFLQKSEINITSLDVKPLRENRKLHLWKHVLASEYKVAES